jgi:hypothetical protein
MIEDKAQEIAGQAQEKAQEATAKTQSMLREQVGQRSNQAGEKVAGTAQDLRSVGEELRNQGKETPAKIADQAAERTERIGSYLTDSGPDELLADVEDFGRRQPWAVLAGGVVAGMAAARFLKASSRSRYKGRTGSEMPTREIQPSGPRPASVASPEPIGAPVPAEPRIPVPADPAMGR